MLAGAQLGITLCSLGLGALAEPAIAHLIDPWLHAAGLPEQVSYAIAFVIALAIVVFLHMVVGEMAPKSWAITHPERSAILLALPFRGFTRAVRPLLRVLNAMANVLLRLVKVQPQDELAAAHGPDELRMLLVTSREHGTLPAEQQQLLSRMLQLQNTTLADVMTPRDQIIAVDIDDGAEHIEQVNVATGRSRLAVLDDSGLIVGVVHVRDAFRAITDNRAAHAAELMTPPFILPATASVLAAVQAMREARAQLAVVTDTTGSAVGLVALEDLLEEVIGEFDDETDTPHPAASIHPVPDSGTSHNP